MPLLRLRRILFSHLQKPGRSFQVGEKHYDVGNDLYKAMLDKRMLYTCGYWKNSADLDAARHERGFPMRLIHLLSLLAATAAAPRASV